MLPDYHLRSIAGWSTEQLWLQFHKARFLLSWLQGLFSFVCSKRGGDAWFSTTSKPESLILTQGKRRVSYNCSVSPSFMKMDNKKQALLFSYAYSIYQRLDWTSFLISERPLNQKTREPRSRGLEMETKLSHKKAILFLVF